MTIAPDKPETIETPVPEGHVKLVIDGEEVIAPKGELLAAHLAGRGQGPAGRDGASAHQPPPGLPDLRQGR